MFTSSSPSDKRNITVINALHSYVVAELELTPRPRKNFILYLGVDQRCALNRVTDVSLFDNEKPEFMGIHVVWVNLTYHRGLFIRTS